MRRNAVLFVVISILSGFGGTAMTLAASLWVLELTGSVGWAALTGLCIYAPTFAAPWLGALVDRLPRRALLIWVDVLLGVLLLALLAVRSAGGAWLIFVVLLARGLGYVLTDAGETAILPAALPASLLGDLNGWRSSAQEGMKLVAPLAGAGLFAWAGAAPVVLTCAAMPLLSAGCYALLRLSGAATAARRPAGRGEIRAGLRALFGNPLVRTPVLVATAAIGLSGLTNAPRLGQLVDGLRLPAEYFGFLSTAQGAGSIAGGLVVGRVLARIGPVQVAALGTALFGAGCLMSCLPLFAALVAGSVVTGVGLPWALIAGITAVQTGIPDELLGRVAASANTAMFGPLVGTIPLGSAAVHLGAVPVLAGTALLAAAVGFNACGRPSGSRC